MHRFFLLMLVLLFAQAALAQEDYPALVGPVVYAGPISAPPVFADLGTGEVWELDTSEFDNDGTVVSWSSDGCYALYVHYRDMRHGLIDLKRRTIDELNLLAGIDSPDASISASPVWSPDGSQFAFARFDGTASTFMVYDLATGTIEPYFSRDVAFERDLGMRVVAWPTENLLIYSSSGERFEVDRRTGAVRYLLDESLVSVPVLPAFRYQLRAPDREMIAVCFDLEESLGRRDVRFVYHTEAELEAMAEAIEPWIGVELYTVETGETVWFDLDDQFVTVAAWSPDSALLAMTVFPVISRRGTTGVYIYERATNTVYPVRGLGAILYGGEFGLAQISWSSNSEWVTANASGRGWVAYSVEEERFTELARPFQSSFVRSAKFTSVTNYPPGACE